jgi:Flp pilus assembly protein TadG
MLKGSLVRTSNSRQRRAATVVEFAVVCPAVFFIILGIIEVGRGLMVIHLLNNASQAGCRVGIIPGKTTDDITTAVTTALTSAGVNGEAVTVEVNDNAANASTANSGDEITVKATVPVSSITWVPITRWLHGTLQGSYTMRRE